MHYVSKWGLRHKVPGEVQTVCETSYTNTLFTFVPYMCFNCSREKTLRRFMRPKQKIAQISLRTRHDVQIQRRQSLRNRQKR